MLYFAVSFVKHFPHPCFGKVDLSYFINLSAYYLQKVILEKRGIP
jgi:hypothetical protein